MAPESKRKSISPAILRTNDTQAYFKIDTVKSAYREQRVHI